MSSENNIQNKLDMILSLLTKTRSELGEEIKKNREILKTLHHAIGEAGEPLKTLIINNRAIIEQNMTDIKESIRGSETFRSCAKECFILLDEILSENKGFKSGIEDYTTFIDFKDKVKALVAA